MIHCDGCRSQENPEKVMLAFLGAFRFTVCRKCAGEVVRQAIKYIKDFDARWPAVKKPRNPRKPIVDTHGSTRCRGCSMQIEYVAGDSPYCGPCRETPKGAGS